MAGAVWVIAGIFVLAFYARLLVALYDLRKENLLLRGILETREPSKSATDESSRGSRRGEF